MKMYIPVAELNSHCKQNIYTMFAQYLLVDNRNECYFSHHCLLGETCRGEGQVRLVNGSIPNEGRVEICIQGVWGSICRTSWGSSESAIVCEQLGFQSESKFILSLQ